MGFGVLRKGLRFSHIPAHTVMIASSSDIERSLGAASPLPDLPQITAVDQHLHPIPRLVLDATTQLIEPSHGLAGLHAQWLDHLVAVIGHFQPVIWDRAAHIG